MIRYLLAAIFLWAATPSALAHGGGVDKNGCHKDRTTGQRHCHGAANRDEAPSPRPAQRKRSEPVSLSSSEIDRSLPDEKVKIAQKMLIRLGYKLGEPDGYLGTVTQSAIKAFEADRGMPQNGVVDDQLIDALIDQLDK
jgi:hypothetical protein